MTSRYQDKEIRFTLLAVNKSKELTINEEINRLLRKKGQAYKALSGLQGGEFNKSAYTDFDRCVAPGTLTFRSSSAILMWRNQRVR